MRKILNTKTIVVLIVCVIAALCIGFSFSERKEIYGQWELSSENNSVDFDYYPSGIIIYENGTALFDDTTVDYSMNENMITFSLYSINFKDFWKSVTYEYELTGNKLMLKYTDDYYSAKTYYERVS